MRLIGQTPFLLLAGALALSTACGGDDDGGDDDGMADPDADTGGDPDADITEVLRAGSIAVAQNTVTDPEAAGVGGLSGATVSIGFIDLSSVTVAPVEGLDNPIGGCAVTVYDLEGGDELPTPTDEGTITVSGTNHEPFGCAFNAGDGEYHCQSATAAHANGSAVDVEAGLTPAAGGATISFTFANPIFTADALKGTFVIMTGFTETAGGASSYSGVPLPVVANTDDTIVVANTVQYAGAGGTGGAGATYSAFIGAGPVPGGFQFIDEGDTVVVAKEASDFIDAFEEDSMPNGVGLTLDDESAQPHEFPTTAAAVSFSCDGTGGDCGESTAGTLNVMTISGEASNGTVEGISPFAMPTDGTKYVTFQCSALVIGSVDMPEAAVAAVLGIEPTRVRTSVGVFAGKFLTDDVPDENARLLIGTLLTGFADITAP